MSDESYNKIFFSMIYGGILQIPSGPEVWI